MPLQQTRIRVALPYLAFPGALSNPFDFSASYNNSMLLAFTMSTPRSNGLCSKRSGTHLGTLSIRRYRIKEDKTHAFLITQTVSPRSNLLLRAGDVFEKPGPCPKQKSLVPQRS